MANFSGAIRFIDGFGRFTTRHYGIEAADFAAAQASMDTLVANTQPLTQCGMVSHRVFQDTDIVTVVTPGANIDAGLTFQWELDPVGSDKKAASKIPSPVDSIFDANGVLDLTNGNVVTYRGVFINGSYLISDGEQPVNLIKGKLDR